MSFVPEGRTAVAQEVLGCVSKHVLKPESLRHHQADLTVRPVTRGEVLQQQHEALQMGEGTA